MEAHKVVRCYYLDSQPIDVGEIVSLKPWITSFLHKDTQKLFALEVELTPPTPGPYAAGNVGQLKNSVASLGIKSMTMHSASTNYAILPCASLETNTKCILSQNPSVLLMCTES
jgi:hypothetical protein